jgi:hypothetical protein
MARFKEGDMWNDFYWADLFCITTNSYIKNDGALVMGRGIARTALHKFPGLDLHWGQRITKMGLANKVYGLLLGSETGDKLSAFQVKTHFRNKASLDIIELSANQLAQFAHSHPSYRISLNYPGIGYGRLDRDVVAPLLQILPDNVTIWSYGKGD